MNYWTEKDFLENVNWYHATSDIFFQKIMENGIIANVNKESELDFGYGFYLSSSEEWARKYAKGFVNARIIKFEFRPIDLLRSGAYHYKFYGELNNEFAEFVFNNRMYFSQDPTFCVHNYDIVCGVMSDGFQTEDFEEFRSNEISKVELFQRLLLPKEDWQIVIHNQELCDRIFPAEAFDLKGGKYDVSSYKKAFKKRKTSLSSGR